MSSKPMTVDAKDGVEVSKVAFLAAVGYVGSWLFFLPFRYFGASIPPDIQGYVPIIITGGVAFVWRFYNDNSD